MLENIKTMWQEALDSLIMDKALEIAAYLELKFPIELYYTPDDKYCGAHYAEMKVTKKGNFKPYHRIIISHAHHNLSNEYIDTVAHELIHAWQWENGFNRNHGKKFKNMVKELDFVFDINSGMAE